MKILTLMMILGTSLHAYAGCRSWGENFDLRKKHPKIMGHLKIQNQGNYGYCYAYAGKFLYDFQRYLKSDKANIYLINLGVTSPAWSAALGMQQSKAFSEEGGYACNVVNGLSSRAQNCAESTITNESFFELGPQIYRFLFDNEGLVSAYQGTANPSWSQFPFLTTADFLKTAKLSGPKLKMRDGFVKFQNKIKAALAIRSILNAVVPSPYYYYELTRKAHFDKNYDELPSAFALSIAEKECTSWRPALKATCEEHPGYSLTSIDEEIEKHRPVGISYCSKFLIDKKYKGQPRTNIRPDCGMHASVLIGRKMDENGSCKYLIRNSWGTSAKYDWKTDEGDIWVDETALEDNLREYQIVK